MSKADMDLIRDRILDEPLNPAVNNVLSIVKRFMLIQRSHRLSHVVFYQSETPLHYLGEGENVDYLAGLLGNYRHEGDVKLAQLAREIDFLKKQHGRNIALIIEVNRLLSGFIPSNAFRSYPWIRQVSSISDYQQRKQYISDVFGRKVRKYGYTIDICREIKILRGFYDDMYLPYIYSRFGSQSIPRSFRMLARQVRNGFLLRVFEEKECVSAVVCRLIRNRLAAVAFGVAHEHEYNLKRGAMSACYYYLFRQAESMGCDHVDLLRSRPNSGDGVFEHKRRWGAKPYRDHWPHTVLGILIPDKVPSGLGNILVKKGGNFLSLSQCIENHHDDIS